MGFLVVLLGCAACVSGPPKKPDGFGVLVMAHGGSPSWNAQVLEAIEPLKSHHDIEVAFGMADPAAMEQGIRNLEARGARRIGVVRLFVSGESFRHRTEQILGLAPGAPPKPEHLDHAAHSHGTGHDMSLWRIESDATFVLSEPGLLEAPAMGQVLAERARALSRQPSEEDVLILAHGPADDEENARWLEHLEARANAVRQALPFRRVQVETLREDWPAKRVEAQRRVRSFVERATREGGRALVIPFRVQGFGPYAKVLEGLDYVSDGRGLIPHPNVTAWIEERIAELEERSRTRARAP
jgi:sirohydrochlorin ferrochelatase